MKTCLLTLVALTTIVFAKAQSVDEIISKHVDAIGGKDKLTQITSVTIDIGMEVMGNESASKTTILNGKAFKSESNFNGQQIVQVVTDKGGWAINPFGGSSTPTPLPADQYKIAEDQIYAPDPLFNYAAHGAKVELQGQEKIGDVNAYKIKYTNKDNSETTYYIDPSTWYIIEIVKKGEAMGQEVTVTVNYSDFKKTDYGVSLPYAMNIDMGQFALKSNVKKVEFNNPVDPAIFELGK
jgi:hypothetical protein